MNDMLGSTYLQCRLNNEGSHINIALRHRSPGIQLVARHERSDDIQRSKLLLSMREPGGHHGNRRKLQQNLVSTYMHHLHEI